MSIDVGKLAKTWRESEWPEGGDCCEVGFLAGYKAAQDQLVDTSKVMDVSSSATLNNWISVKDSLPPPRRVVLYFHELHGPSVGHYNPDYSKPGYKWISEEWVDNKTDRITHWMPLPKPPKGWE